MSDSEDTADNAEAITEDAKDAFKPITSQEELNRIVQSRVARVKSQFEDYDSLKEKAGRFDAVSSELAELKTADQIRDWKSQVSKDSGIPADALRGSTLEELQSHGEQLKSLFNAQPAKRGPVVPDSGKQPETKLSDDVQFTRELFGRL